jgi:superfamily II DNA or RNA helicase
VILRDYQRAALDGAREQLRRGKRAVLLVLPTGTGKTVVFSEAIRLCTERGGKALVLAHRTELLEQARAKLRAVAPDLRVELEQAGARASTRADVVVASVQSLKGPRLTRFAPDAFPLLIVDEAHHATAKSYRTILDHFARARVLGVTATPDRADETALGEVFDGVGFTYEMRAAIADGYLVPLRLRSVVVEALHLEAVKSRGGDLVESELIEAMAGDEVLLEIADPLPELAGDRPTIVFVAGVANAHRLAALMNARRPDVAVALDGDTDSVVRRVTLRRFEAGEFQFLINVGLFTEGFDSPRVSCVAMARPTQSRGLYAQCLGRGTRALGGVIDPCPDAAARTAAIAASAKPDLLVVDFTTASAQHRLVNPADVLGGSAAASARAAQHILRNPTLTVSAALELAQAEEDQEEQRRLSEGYTRFAEEWAWLRQRIDLDEIRAIDQREIAGATIDLVTLRARLVDRGLGIDRSKKLTSGQALVLDRLLEQRARDGLCSLKQANQLRRFGRNPNVTPGAAGAVLGRFFAGVGARRA